MLRGVAPSACLPARLDSPDRANATAPIPVPNITFQLPTELRLSQGRPGNDYMASELAANKCMISLEP